MTSFSTGHAGMIHDAQLDYYGQRLATASSDHTIRIFEINGIFQISLALFNFFLLRCRRSAKSGRRAQGTRWTSLASELGASKVRTLIGVGFL
jgi:hypothetical protein